MELKLVNANIRSLKDPNKKDLFLLFIAEHNPDIITITETWENAEKSYLYNEFLDGYLMVSHSPKLTSEGIGGGVATFVTKNLYKFSCPLAFNVTEDSHQIQLIKVHDVIIVNIYRSPNQEYIEQNSFLDDFRRIMKLKCIAKLTLKLGY